MQAPLNSLWAFIKSTPLSFLTIKNIRSFIKNDLDTFQEDDRFFDTHLHITDADLFRLLFSEIEETLQTIQIDSDLSLHDQLFDFLMTATDLYQDRKNTIKKLENEVLSSPTHLKDFIYYGRRLSKNIFTRFNIKRVNIPFKEIPFISDFLPNYIASIPQTFHAETFSLLLLHFIKIWLQDDSEFSDKTMSDFNQALTFINMHKY
ncbi:MAG TPA: hypothetical protein DIC42_01710 [Holosporales bacterium]|nr:hypothetical protein [Holosporales bacterium]